MTRNSFPILFALLLAVSLSAPAADARKTETKAGGTGSFAAVAENLKWDAERAFAREQWSEAAAAYGRFVGHLLKGGYAEGSNSVAGSRLRIAVAFNKSGDYAAAQTMLSHLAESTPEYEKTKRLTLLNEVLAAHGLPHSPVNTPPVEAAHPEGPIRAGGDVTRPELVSRFTPEYTLAARRARIQGVVIVEVTIDTEGNVNVVKVLKPLPMGLDRMAVDAVKEWKFRPATLRGKPVEVFYNLTVNFRLP